jgi:hypothetical protein
LDCFVNQASSRAASYHTVSMKALLCITAKLRADVADGSGAHFRDVREESGLPLTPDILRHRSEPPLSARTLP